MNTATFQAEVLVRARNGRPVWVRGAIGSARDLVAHFSGLIGTYGESGVRFRRV